MTNSPDHPCNYNFCPKYGDEKMKNYYKSNASRTTRKTSVILVSIFILLLCIFTIPPVSAITIEEQAIIIKDESYASTIDQNFNDKAFAYNVHKWVNNNVHFTTPLSWNVNSTDLTWENRIGDCSEISLIEERMLKPYMDVHVVSGLTELTMSGQWHDTVEIHIRGEKPYIIDEKYFPKFNKVYDGMHPTERIVYTN